MQSGPNLFSCSLITSAAEPVHADPSLPQDLCMCKGRKEWGKGLPSGLHRCPPRAWCCSCLSCRDSSWLCGNGQTVIRSVRPRQGHLYPSVPRACCPLRTSPKGPRCDPGPRGCDHVRGWAGPCSCFCPQRHQLQEGREIHPALLLAWRRYSVSTQCPVCRGNGGRTEGTGAWTHS